MTLSITNIILFTANHHIRYQTMCEVSSHPGDYRGLYELTQFITSEGFTGIFLRQILQTQQVLLLSQNIVLAIFEQRFLFEYASTTYDHCNKSS